MGRDICDEPQPEPAQDLRDVRIHSGLHGGIDLAVERVDAGFQRRQPEGAFRDHEGARDVVARRARHLLHPRDEERAGQVDDAIGERGRDDLALEAMLAERFGETLHRGGGEIAREHGGEGRIVGQIARDDLCVEVELGIGEQHRELGPRQAFGFVLELLELAVGGEELHRAVEPAAPFQVAHIAAMRVEVLHRARLRDGERQRLVVIVL